MPERMTGGVLFTAVVAVGSLWGLSEVLLNEAVRPVAEIPRAGVLCGTGALLVGVALGCSRRIAPLLALPLVAIAIKQMVVPLVGATVTCKANSCLGVLLQGAAWTGLAALSTARRATLPRLIGVGAVGALAAAVPFYLVGMRLAPCPYLLSFQGTGGLIAFASTDGVIWAALSGIGLPIGHEIGRRLARPLRDVEARRPALYWAASAAAILGCWLVAALSILSTGPLQP